MKVSEEVRFYLKRLGYDQGKLYINGDLDRKTYLALNKVLESIGAKWSRKDKAHIYDGNVEAKIGEILATGEYTDEKKDIIQKYQFYPTPDDIVGIIAKKANVQEGETVLEPSAGRGAIANRFKFIDCIEIMPENRKYLIDNDYNLVWDDFLTFDKAYDVIVANPPFTKNQYVDHINHMINLSRKRILTIAPSSLLNSSIKKVKALRELIYSLNGTIEELPVGSFKDSGTMVNSVLVYIDKG
jgi:type I restriction-modification system DNA methylase subunit